MDELRLSLNETSLPHRDLNGLIRKLMELAHGEGEIAFLERAGNLNGGVP